MQPHKDYLTLLWHILCLGFLSSLIAFIIGQGCNTFIAGKSAGTGFVAISRFLLNPSKNQIIYQKESPFSKEPEWIAYGKIIRIIYFPFALILLMILSVQATILILSSCGAPLLIKMVRMLKYLFQPEHVKYIIH